MKTIRLDCGPLPVDLRVPDRADILSLPNTPALADTGAAVRAALEAPIGTPPIAEIVARKKQASTAVIVVSDNTRPVPYKEPGGILVPLLDSLRNQGVWRIVVLVATGTHRVMREDELRALLPAEVFAPGIEVVCHDCEERSHLRYVGTTARGTEAFLNTHYLDADVKILTGLVEPHFMAGVSGGRKSICPGIVGLETTRVFHGPALMAHDDSESFSLDGNPCHEEALSIARLAPPDFIVNVTINDAKAVTGVFAGEMEKAHRVASDAAIAINTVALTHVYDLVVTHAGFVGINHYQAAKAACEGVKAVRQGGTLLLVADHTDAHSVGGANYRRILPLLAEHGPESFTRKIFAPDWTFVPEQWQVQMWARVLRKLGAAEKLIYCAPQFADQAFARHGLPGSYGGAPQDALDRLVKRMPDATVAILKDGPYGVPRLV